MDTNNQSILQGSQTTQSSLPSPIAAQTYLENILRLNIGKLGTFYFTYTGSTDWRDRAYKGTIEQVGRDHLILKIKSTISSSLSILTGLNLMSLLILIPDKQKGYCIQQCNILIFLILPDIF